MKRSLAYLLLVLFAVRPAVPKTTVVSVASYGATGNGTTDDTAAINRAIAALAPGQTLLFPCGTYLLSAALIPINKSNVQVVGPSLSCATLHARSSNKFTVFTVTGGGLSPSKKLAADVLPNTFTLVSGGAGELGLAAGDYVLISDTPVSDNGPGSPLISTQEVVKVTGVLGDKVSIEGTFAWMFTLISPHPAQWGGSPSAQKLLNPVSGVVVRYLTIDGTGSTGPIWGLHFDYAVGGEVGFVNISNLTGSTAAHYGFNAVDGYKNNFHDMNLTNASNGPISANGEDMNLNSQSYASVSNINIWSSAGQHVFGFGHHSGQWGTLSHVAVDLGGALGRGFKLLRANHNVLNSITANNTTGLKNGINVTDVSQFNTFNNCAASGNDKAGIAMFGSYDVNNTFNNCIIQRNKGGQFAMNADASGQYADDNVTISGGRYSDDRGGHALVQDQGVGFTMTSVTLTDDNHTATAGLSVTAEAKNCSVGSNTFSALPKGKDIYVTGGAGCHFSGNSTPDGKTPTTLP